MRTNSVMRFTFVIVMVMLLTSGRADSGAKDCRPCDLKVQPEGAAAADPFKDLLGQLIVQPPISHAGLTVFPLAWAGDPDASEYLTLSRATDDKVLTVTELESASVPELKLVSRARRPVFLMTGEVLTGAKQDRILAHDVLIDPSVKDLKIPVYCVENGRWTEKSREFEPAANMATPNVRSKAQSKSSQSKIWEEVAEVNNSMDYDSGGSLQQGFNDEKSKERRARFMEALSGVPDRKDLVGAVVVVNGSVAGMDVFSSPALFADLWPKLLESYALEAEDQAPGRNAAGPGDVRNFAGKIFDARYRELENPGAGAEFLIEAADASGSALVADGKVLHLALFPGKAEPPMERMDSGGTPPHLNAPNPSVLDVQQIQNQLPDGTASRPDSFKKGGGDFRLSNPEKHKIGSGK